MRDFWFEMMREIGFSSARAFKRERERERAFKRVKEKEKCNNEFSSRRAFLSLSFLTLR
jgi:hypothetical protein